jgi:hypothetical protein
MPESAARTWQANPSPIDTLRAAGVRAGRSSVHERYAGSVDDVGRVSSWPRDPSRWQEDELAFLRECARDPHQFQRMSVVFRWWTRPLNLPGAVGILLWVVRLLRGRTEGRFVALYRPDATPGTPPFLCFEVLDEAFGQAAAGEGQGVLVGGPVPIGTVVLEADGQVIVPLRNPTSPTGDAPRR